MRQGSTGVTPRQVVSLAYLYRFKDSEVSVSTLSRLRSVSVEGRSKESVRRAPGCSARDFQNSQLRSSCVQLRCRNEAQSVPPRCVIGQSVKRLVSTRKKQKLARLFQRFGSAETKARLNSPAYQLRPPLVA